MIIIMKLCRALPQYPSQPYFCLPWLSFLRIPRSLVLARHFFSTLSIASDSSRTSFSFPFFPPLHKRSFRSTARFPRRMRGCLLRKNRAQRNQTPKCARAFYLGTNLGPWMHTSRWKNFSFSLSLSVLLFSLSLFRSEIKAFVMGTQKRAKTIPKTSPRDCKGRKVLFLSSFFLFFLCVPFVTINMRYLRVKIQTTRFVFAWFRSFSIPFFYISFSRVQSWFC